MKVETFFYNETEGWSVSTFPTVSRGDAAGRVLVLVFASPYYKDHQKPLKELLQQYPDATMAGCSTSGEILNNRVMDDSIVVAVIEFEKTTIKMIGVPVVKPDKSFSVGEYLGEQLQSNDLKSVILFSDGVKVNGSQLVCGVNSALPETIVVAGGLAGDGGRFKQTWVIQQGEILPDHVLGIGFYGDSIIIGCGAEGGWDIFGQERTVTRSDKNVVYSIDDQPALALYKQYLGDRVSELPAAALLFPLAIRKESDDDAEKGGRFLVRTILAVNEEDQSMMFAGDIEEGSKVQLMKTNYTGLVLGASEAAKQAGKDFSIPSDILSIAVSCVGRRLVLGERTDEELEAVVDILPEKTHQIGFYSYGEISPHGVGYCDLHNQTMTLILIGER